MDKHFQSYSIDDRSYVAFVKREIHSCLAQSDFSKNRIAEVDIVVSELTSNLLKHAGHGDFLWRLTVISPDMSLLEMITIDAGPGIADVPRAMKDGVSTKNTLGQGLGAISRLADHFQIYSLPEWGTVCHVMMNAGPAAVQTGIKPANDVEMKWLSVPKAKETYCGDGVAIKKSKDFVKVMVADGLGHGFHAHEAVQKAKEYFLQTTDMEPVDIIHGLHSAVRKTRGMVASVAVLNFRERRWKICGVGNIATRLYGGMMFKHYMAYNGIVGLNIPGSIKETVVDAERNQQLIMCSDGIRTRWDLTKYPSVYKYDSMLLAAALYKDFSRGTDDSSIFIGKVILEK
jgi:anti-sigma regulatory factor (Ser/Thr protein kinase)